MIPVRIGRRSTRDNAVTMAFYICRRQPGSSSTSGNDEVDSFTECRLNLHFQVRRMLIYLTGPRLLGLRASYINRINPETDALSCGVPWHRKHVCYHLVHGHLTVLLQLRIKTVFFDNTNVTQHRKTLTSSEKLEQKLNARASAYSFRTLLLPLLLLKCEGTSAAYQENIK